MRAALYARVSSRKQEDNFSLRQQLDATRAHAVSKGYEVVVEEQDVISGTTHDRLGMGRIQDLADARKIDVVLVQDHDRISRDSDIATYFAVYFRIRDCRLRTIEEPEHETPESALVGNVMKGVAQYQRLDIIRKTTRGSRQRAKEGQVLGSGTPPYGFRRNSDGTNFEIDDTMPVVRRIFEMVASGNNIHQVKATLEAENVPPPGNNLRAGERWYPMTIRRMVLSDAYKGTWWYGRNGDDAIPVAIPDPGIPHETIDAARAAISNNRKIRSNARHYYELRA